MLPSRQLFLVLRGMGFSKKGAALVEFKDPLDSAPEETVEPPSDSEPEAEVETNPVRTLLAKMREESADAGIGKAVRLECEARQLKFIEMIDGPADAWMYPDKYPVVAFKHPGGAEYVVIMNSFTTKLDSLDVDFGFVVDEQAVKHGSGFLFRDDRNDLANYVRGEREGLPKDQKFYTKAMPWRAVDGKYVRVWLRIGKKHEAWRGKFVNYQLVPVSREEYDAYIKSIREEKAVDF